MAQEWERSDPFEELEGHSGGKKGWGKARKAFRVILEVN